MLVFIQASRVNFPALASSVSQQNDKPIGGRSNNKALLPPGRRQRRAFRPQFSSVQFISHTFTLVQVVYFSVLPFWCIDVIKYDMLAVARYGVPGVFGLDFIGLIFFLRSLYYKLVKL